MNSYFMPIMAWTYSDAACRHLVGIVVELPDTRWQYKELRPEDRMHLPVSTRELTQTLLPYITPPTNGEDITI